MKNTLKLTMDELEQVAGGKIDGYIHVDMSEYHCTYYSLAMGAACHFNAQGCSRETAIQEVYNFYETNYHIVMENLDQCITQEEWDRIR